MAPPFAPPIRQNAPKAGGSSRSIRGLSSNFRFAPLRVRENSPSIRLPAPGVRGNSRSILLAAPRVRGNYPNPRGRLLRPEILRLQPPSRLRRQGSALLILVHDEVLTAEAIAKGLPQSHHRRNHRHQCIDAHQVVFAPRRAGYHTDNTGGPGAQVLLAEWRCFLKSGCTAKVESRTGRGRGGGVWAAARNGRAASSTLIKPAKRIRQASRNSRDSRSGVPAIAASCTGGGYSVTVISGSPSSVKSPPFAAALFRNFEKQMLRFEAKRLVGSLMMTTCSNVPNSLPS